MTGWRLFVAAVVPDEATVSIWESLAAARRRHPEARWIEPASMHLTLVFLGSTDPLLVPQVARAIDEVVVRYPALRLEVIGAGGRADDRRGGVAWLRLGGAGAQPLGELARELDAAVPPTPGRGRLHSAHLTVARRVTEPLLRELVAPRVRFHVDRVALFRSHTGPNRARYEALHEATLPLTHLAPDA